jgi:hypothetical protein
MTALVVVLTILLKMAEFTIKNLNINVKIAAGNLWETLTIRALISIR